MNEFRALHKELGCIYNSLITGEFTRLESLEKAARGDKYDRIAMKLNDLLLSHWSKETQAVIKDVIRTIAKGEGLIGEEEITLILKRLDERLGTRLAAGIESAINEKMIETYEFSQKEILAAVPTFNLVDEKAINWLNKDLTFWIGNHYQDGLSDKIRDLSKEVLKQGFGRDEAGNFFQGKFGDAFKRSKSYWELLSNNSVTRGREFGRTESYVKADIKFLKVVAVLDKRTSSICRLLNGMVFPVSHAVKVRDRLLNATSPAKVKKIAPWVKPGKIAGKKAGKLRHSMAMPPYHAHCRTRTIKATAAESLAWEKQKIKSIND